MVKERMDLLELLLDVDFLREALRVLDIRFRNSNSAHCYECLLLQRYPPSLAFEVLGP